MNVSVVIPTRGNVDLMPIVESYPDEWQVVVYNNGAGHVQVMDGGREEWDIIEHGLPDLAVYARYAAIQYASHYLIVTQDDDCIVSDPAAIVDGLIVNYGAVVSNPLDLAPGASLPPVTHLQIATARVVCNMPQEFRHDGYTDSALVGFGAAFHRDLPERVWQKFDGRLGIGVDFGFGGDAFNRTCDVVFTALTDRVLVDVPKVNREFAEDPDRMYRQADHVGERARMLAHAREARNA